MAKLYAVISPAVTYFSSSISDALGFAIEKYHEMAYEQVCGYSLGHSPVFFNTLEEAQDQFEKAIATPIKLHTFKIRQKAIIELEFDRDKITGFSKIYTPKIKKLRNPAAENETFFYPVDIPEWNEDNIYTNDISANALSAINRQYKNSYARQSLFDPDYQHNSSCTIV